MNFAGMSKPNDLPIAYYLKSAASGDVKVRVYDGSRMIAELDGATTAGVNVVRWDLMERRERIQGEAAPTGGGRGGGRGGGAPAAGGQVQTRVTPGTYRVVLAVGGREYSQPAIVMADPNPGSR
jgi:hypothetical protein